MLHITDSLESLLADTADFFVRQANDAIQNSGKFTVALSGGSSPKLLYTLLASDRYSDKVKWEHVYFFFGDERFVPSNDPQSNYRMARETLFDPLLITNDKVFPVNTTVSPAESALLYEQAIKNHLGVAGKFDLILLGLGDNSHTASLFPHTAVLHEKQSLVKEVFVQEVNQYRITLTAPLINDAKTIAFLVYGKGKADAVHHILKDPFNPEEYPAQLIQPISGSVHWFLDKDAASRVA
ncbi:6-phosphogluconolactonase [Chryseosolibacter indicus]|uniref:6-phosphogluconolactonase n=1 Tax=Chryseosolibacter indicus TaxID=2782351 RepID=A0ABS5VUR1_9BACT|nr:6-phosphogluconolactonase [Chryseosolibacter indicus]MBT1704494.1 6-phosphogluconolactonase [Chryseosolibacter indicus]